MEKKMRVIHSGVGRVVMVYMGLYCGSRWVMIDYEGMCRGA